MVQNKTILVTGSAGLIGFCLSERITPLGRRMNRRIDFVLVTSNL